MIGTQSEGHPTRYMTSTPQNCQSLEKQGVSEELLRPEQTEM